jgi:hypothetical protein
VATVYQEFPPGAAAFPATNFAAPTITQGTNFPVPALAFDAATDEAAYFFFQAFNYGSGNLTVTLDWYADTASSGDVVWTAAIAAITPDTDSGDIETKAFATANTVTDSHLGTTNQRLHRASITVSNLDSIAAGDWVCLKVTRDADNGSDTMTGDSLLSKLVVSYSDT